MTEFQVITVLATALGIVATVLNLVAFVREKDRSHTRAGLLVLLGLVALVALVLMPHYAPGTARRLTSRLPLACRPYIESWLALPAPSPEPSATDAPCPLTGSFNVEIRRNFFGGISSLEARFQFVNLSAQAVRVTSFRIRIPDAHGQTPHCYERVLPKPVVVTANGNGQAQVELNGEIRDPWLAWHNLDVAKRGPIEIRWECQDAQGNRFTVLSSNG